jgi:hypothetical protein
MTGGSSCRITTGVFASPNEGPNQTTGWHTPITPNLPRVQSLLAITIIETARPGSRGADVPGKPGGFRAVLGCDRVGYFNPAARARMIA